MSSTPRSPRRGSLRSTGTGGAALDALLRLPRNTPSAAPAHRSARGMDALLASFDPKTQLGIRRLCYERLELLAKRRAAVARMGALPQAVTPQVIIDLDRGLTDSSYNLRRLLGAGSGTTDSEIAGETTFHLLLDALKEPGVAEEAAADALGEGCGNEEATEEGTDARVWRRRLENRRVVRSDAPYRYSDWDSPSVRGDRDGHNVANRNSATEGLSYYQKQQLKYGRARRGSTSIAGAY